MRIYILILITFLITNCADTHMVVRTLSASVKLDAKASAYISIPRDGQYGKINYVGSGATTSQIILSVFSKYIIQAETGREYQSYKEAFNYAKANDFDYLIYPSILAWEDRATEWSSIPDKVSIKISVIQVSTTKAIDSAIIKGKSGIATFGGDHPQDLLEKPIDDYVKTLF